MVKYRPMSVTEQTLGSTQSSYADALQVIKSWKEKNPAHDYCVRIEHFSDRDQDRPYATAHIAV